jgi:hypothetical protein
MSTLFQLSKIEDEVSFPIFSVSAKWLQDETDPETRVKYPNWYVDVPEGKKSNGTGYDVMKNGPVTLDQIIHETNQWWLKYSQEKQFPNVQDLKLDVRYKKHEVWYCTWFCHTTFDLGQTDEQILKSFENYIDRTELLNEKLREEQNIVYRDQTPKGGECLMGAEDRWRWRGENDNSNPPCRCAGCKKWGVIRINH